MSEEKPVTAEPTQNMKLFHIGVSSGEAYKELFSFQDDGSPGTCMTMREQKVHLSLYQMLTLGEWLYKEAAKQLGQSTAMLVHPGLGKEAQATGDLEMDFYRYRREELHVQDAKDNFEALRDAIVARYGVADFLDAIGEAPVYVEDGELRVKPGSPVGDVAWYLIDRATRTGKAIKITVVLVDLSTQFSTLVAKARNVLREVAN